jgi:hypothetical protein
MEETLETYEKKCELQDKLDNASAKHNLNVALKSIKASRMCALVEQNALTKKLAEEYLSRKLSDQLKLDQSMF